MATAGWEGRPAIRIMRGEWEGSGWVYYTKHTQAFEDEVNFDPLNHDFYALGNLAHYNSPVNKIKANYYEVKNRT